MVKNPSTKRTYRTRQGKVLQFSDQHSPCDSEGMIDLKFQISTLLLYSRKYRPVVLEVLTVAGEISRFGVIWNDSLLLDDTIWVATTRWFRNTLTGELIVIPRVRRSLSHEFSSFLFFFRRNVRREMSRMSQS